MATDLDVPDPGLSKRLWAAYVLGRYPYALMAWHEAFFIDPREIAPRPMPEALNAPLDEIPDLYLDLDDAVRELALAHEIDAYLHVEIRNSIYRSEEASRELLRMVDETPPPQSISELVYSSRRPLFFLTELSQAAVLHSPDTKLWKQLGDFIGRWMEILKTLDLEEIRPWRNVDEFLERLDDESIRERLRPVVDLWGNLQQLRDDQTSLGELLSSIGALMRRVGDVDALFLKSQRGEVVGGPLLIVDQANQQFTFLGYEFRFDEFKGHAQAGMKCFRFLAEHPQVWFPRPEIALGAGIEVNPEQLSADISSFRGVVRRATKPYGERLVGRQRREADAAFIVPKRTKRHARGEEGAYKLAVDAARIEFR